MLSLRHSLAALMITAAVPAHAEDVWHATHALMPGDIVQPADIAAEPLQRVWPGALPASTPILGLEVKHYISPTRPLVDRDVGPRSLVKANTSVTVLWREGGLSLELNGRALEDGANGDEVRVLNPTTSRTIRGFVVGEGMVEVRTMEQ